MKRPSPLLGAASEMGDAANEGTFAGPMADRPGSDGVGGQGLAATRPCRKMMEGVTSHMVTHTYL